MEERKIMPAVTIRKVSEMVVIGKLLGVCMAALSFADGIPADILNKIERFAYGIAPDEFTPEWWEEAAALTNRIAEIYPESKEALKEVFEDIAAIANAVLK